MTTASLKSAEMPIQFNIRQCNIRNCHFTDIFTDSGHSSSKKTTHRTERFDMAARGRTQTLQPVGWLADCSTIELLWNSKRTRNLQTTAAHVKSISANYLFLHISIWQIPHKTFAWFAVPSLGGFRNRVNVEPSPLNPQNADEGLIDLTPMLKRVRGSWCLGKMERLHQHARFSNSATGGKRTFPAELSGDFRVYGHRVSVGKSP